MDGRRQSAVIVPIAAVEPVVGRHRLRLDPAASWGVPAHVTVLFPFVEPDALTDGVLTSLAEAVASVPAFACSFTRCSWFGDDVLWLAPEPDAGFAALIAAVCRAFPQHRPYGGAFDDVVPHLTVGERRHATLPALRAAERAVSAALPVAARIEHAAILTGSATPGGWRTVRRLPLGAGES